MLKASIIIPVKNEEKYISKVLDSLIAQDYPKENIEILIVDAISQTIHDEKLWHEITKKGHERIRSEFNLHSNVQQLLNLIVRLRG